MSKKAARKIRRKAILETIRGLSDEELTNLSHEIGREMDQQRVHLNALRQRLELSRAELKRRRQTTDNGFRVSDHAVLRYLERIKGFDIASVRKEIEALAIARGWKDTGDQYGRKIDEETGFTFGVNGKNNVITTILGKKEEMVMIAREDT